jgi:chorismate mutase
MDNLEKLRKRVDEVDDQILLALCERVKVCKAIGDLKKKQSMPIKDPDRENEVYKRIRKKATEFGLDSSQVEAVYREIVNICTVVQK